MKKLIHWLTDPRSPALGVNYIFHTGSRLDRIVIPILFLGSLVVTIIVCVVFGHAH